MSTTWTTDGGVAEGVATVDPKELHRGLATSTMAALRTGVPAEWLDAVATWRIDQTLGLIGTSEQLRRDHLTTVIAESKRKENNARRNANSIDDADLAGDFLRDAAQARRARQRAEQELADLDLNESQWSAPQDFEAELDFFARALGNLAETDGPVDGTVAQELEHVFQFTGIDVSSYPDATLEFYVSVPALGRVLRLGPLYCTVQNRGYPARLPDDVRPDPASTSKLAPGSAGRSEVQVLDDVRTMLVARGWTLRAAGVAA